MAKKGKTECECGSGCSCGCGKGGSSGACAHGVYGMAVIGAAVYFIKGAATFGAGALGVGKAIFWPAVLMYELLKYLKI